MVSLRFSLLKTPQAQHVGAGCLGVSVLYEHRGDALQIFTMEMRPALSGGRRSWPMNSAAAHIRHQRV